jgi:hypothetical protein
MLREVAAKGVWVSAHPDVILKMGTKQVLFRARHLGWRAETDLYRTLDELRGELPRRLASLPRVLKRNRGNGGIGTWKVELPAHGSSKVGPDTIVRVLHARRGSVEGRAARRLHEPMRTIRSWGRTHDRSAFPAAAAGRDHPVLHGPR